MDSKALQYVKKLGPLIGLILLFVIICHERQFP